MYKISWNYKIYFTSVLAIAVICILTANSTQAAPLELKVFKKDKYETVKIQEHKGLRLSGECFKTKTPKCQALDESARKVTPSKSAIPLEGNPAARLCLDHGGLNRILLSSDQKQYDYCLFKDGSMVDAWDLYNHFNPKKVIE